MWLRRHEPGRTVGLPRHRPAQPPRDGDRTLTAVLDVVAEPEAQERRRAEVVGGGGTDEQGDVRAELAMVQVPVAGGGQRGGCVVGEKSRSFLRRLTSSASVRSASDHATPETCVLALRVAEVQPSPARISSLR